MKILLTNDDGFDAPGLKALFEAVRPLGEVFISAPDEQVSASGHSISLREPFRVLSAFWQGAAASFRISSTPADCVRTAVLKLLPEKPDLVISGINQGANFGSLILYSGTVAAAAEAVLLGIPSIAVSLTSHHSKDFSVAAQFSALLCKKIQKKPLPPGVFLNVNVPPLSADQIHGVRLTSQGLFRHIDDLEPHAEIEGHFNYILDSPHEPVEEHPETDVYQVKKGWISVTPLQLDLTARESFPYFASWAWGPGLWKE
jgi:5'-nucleotidase